MTSTVELTRFVKSTRIPPEEYCLISILQYSSLKWTHEHFTGVDWDHRTRKKGIYRITSDQHKGWSKWVDSENGNYDYLLGIDVSES